MTPNQIEYVLSGISYKPGHMLNYRWRSRDAVEVWWSFERPDSRDPNLIELGESGRVLIWAPDIEDDETLVRTIFGMTLRLEEHEAREFLLYNGQRPFDPHKELLR